MRANLFTEMIRGRTIHNPSYFDLLGEVMVPRDNPKRYPDGQYDMPLDKYEAMYGPCVGIAKETSFLEEDILLLRCPCAQAARDAASRIKIASETKKVCLPNIQHLLFALEQNLSSEGMKTAISEDTFFFENTPAWIWQHEKPVNILADAHYGNAWLVVFGGNAWISANKTMETGRRISVPNLIALLEEEASALEKYACGKKASFCKSTLMEEAEKESGFGDGKFPFPENYEYENIFLFRNNKWDERWETPDNTYPCLVLPCRNAVEKNKRKDVKLVFPNAESVGEAYRRVSGAAVPMSRDSELSISLYGLCVGRYAETNRVYEKPVYVEELGEYIRGKFSRLSEVRSLQPAHIRSNAGGTFGVYLTYEDELLFFFNFFFYQAASVKREEFLQALETLKCMITAFEEKH